jgi:hypothetical protein
MTLLNRPSNGHVPSMVVLWRTARVFGPMPRAKLEALCRPRVKPDDSRMPATFTTWKSLGMFVEGDDESVRLTPPFDTIDETDTETLRTAVLDLLLRPDNNPALLAVDLSKEAEASRASDFVRVASWALAQDPSRLASWNQGGALEHAHAQGIELFRGDGRWPSFQEWAYFVGLGVPTKHGLVLSPARAIREALSGDHARVGLPADKEVPLTTFLEDIAKAIPVVDGGAYRVQIDVVLRANGHGFAAHQVSPCLALALLQLHHEEEIVLADRPGDVAARLSLLGRAGAVVRTASHIRRGAPRRAHRPAVPTEAEGSRA